MGKQKITPETVATPNFPAYSIAAVGDRYVIVGGGGGAARTGVKNKFDVYELYHTGKQTKAERVISHDVGEACISNLSAWCDKDSAKAKEHVNPIINLALGQEEQCVLLQLSPKLSSALPVDEIELDDPIEEEPEPSSPVRRRNKQPTKVDSRLKEEIAKKRKNERIRRESINSTLRGDQYFSFDIEESASVQSVLREKNSSSDETYQKVVRVSHNHQVIATGGTDGRIRIWSIPLMEELCVIKAHEKEVDDLDFRPDGKQLISISKPTRECCVWGIKDCKKVIQLALPTNGIKYKFFKARYGLVEDNAHETRLFTISNAVAGSKNSGILAHWDTKTYSLKRTQDLSGHLSSLAVSDNGRYIAAGTMDGGIYIVIAFSLQIFHKIEDAHNMFITGLEWMPTRNMDSQMVCGFSDASVLSISCDNTLKIHHVPRVDMVPVWMVALLAAIVLFGCFIIGGYLGL